MTTARAPLAQLMGAAVCLLVTAGGVRAQSPGCDGDIPEIYPVATVEVQFDRRFTGSYRHGEPNNVLTILPDGTGETLSQAGIHLRVRLWCSFMGTPQQPIQGMPADQMILWASGLCVGTPLQADHATDADGYTEFSGTMAGGGCASSLTMFVYGLAVSPPIPILVNSPDTGGATPCALDASDLSALAARLGVPSRYSICSDFDESGVIDASDLSFFAAALGRAGR